MEIRERLDCMENEEDDVFFRSTSILWAGDITLSIEGVPCVFAALIAVDVDNPIDLRLSSSSLFLIFSLIVFSSCVLLGVFSGWFV